MKKLLIIIGLAITSLCFGQNKFSLEFDSQDKLDLGYLNSFNASGNVTIEAWVKPYFIPLDSPPSESSYTIFSLGGNGHLALSYNNNSNFVFTLVFQNNNQLSIIPNIEYIPNNWYHIAGVYDSSNNIGYLFVNGDLVGSINTPNEDLYIPNSINSNIGSYYQPFYGRHFQGAISSVHLTQDIKYSSNFCPETNLQQTSNTIGLWLMNEGAGTTINDSVSSFNGVSNGPLWITDAPIENIPNYIPMDGLDGWWSFNGDAIDQSVNGNNGTINGAILTTDRDGYCDRAYLFDGTNDNIELLNPYFSGNSTVSEFTFSYWIYLNSLPQTSSDYYAILHFDSYWRQKFTGIDSDGIINYGGANSNPNEFFGFSSTTNTIQANQWYNVVFTFKNGLLSFYLNGLEISNINVSQSALDYSKVISGNSNGKNLIGSRTSVSNGDYAFFDGKIDDIGVWQRKLTNDEITAVSNSQTLHLTEKFTNKIKIYPNPFSNQINVKINNKSSYQIYSLNGRKINEGIIHTGENIISTDNLSTGIYYLRIISKNNAALKKLIKK